jgi:hypothetical protein
VTLGSRTRDALRIGLGAALVLAFFSMSATVVGIDVGFRPPWNNHTAGELHFWVCWLLLLVPGAVLIGAGLAPALSGRAARAWTALGALDGRGRLGVIVLLFGAGLLAARLGHHLVLLDFWITDDEPAARLGGQILASGRWMLPLPATWDLWPSQFLYVNAAKSAYTSIDWTGVQLAWALAEISGAGSGLFAVAAGLPAPLVAWAVGRRLGPAWGAVAGAMLLVSPMALTLSFTTHAHVLSRAWIAAALCLYVAARSGGSGAGEGVLRWWGGGLCLGFAFITRPFETGLLFAPLGVLTLYEAIAGDARLRRGLGALVAGAVLPLAFFALHNAILTGEPWRPPRFAHADMFTGAHRSPFAFLSDPGVLWSRLGNNVAYNAAMLALWFLGPLGVVAVAVGAGVDRFTRALGLGVVCNLALGLLHDDAGLHIVGPIHYSESAVPLAVLATHGLARAAAWLGRVATAARDADPDLRSLPVRVGVAGGIASVLALLVFTGWHARALHGQARIHAGIFGRIEALDLQDAVLLAPYYGYVWRSIPAYRETGAWVFHWPPADPDRTANVIFAHQLEPELTADRIARLRAEFPGRRLYALRGTDDERGLIIEPIPLPAPAPERAGRDAARAAPPGTPPS